MPKSTTIIKSKSQQRRVAATKKPAAKKGFSRESFERVKKLQAKGQSRADVAIATQFGISTVGKAFRAKTWSSYRRAEIGRNKSRRMAAADHVADKKLDAALAPDPVTAPYLPQADETDFSKGFHPKKTSLFKRLKDKLAASL